MEYTLEDVCGAQLLRGTKDQGEVRFWFDTTDRGRWVFCATVYEGPDGERTYRDHDGLPKEAEDALIERGVTTVYGPDGTKVMS